MPPFDQSHGSRDCVLINDTGTYANCFSLDGCSLTRYDWRANKSPCGAGHHLKLPTKRSQRPNTRGGDDMVKRYEVTMASYLVVVVEADSKEEAFEAGLDRFNAEREISSDSVEEIQDEG